MPVNKVNTQGYELTIDDNASVEDLTTELAALPDNARLQSIDPGSGFYTLFFLEVQRGQ